MNAVLDTGAGVSIIDSRTLAELQIAYKLDQNKDKELFDASGNRMDVEGVTMLDISIPQEEKT